MAPAELARPSVCIHFGKAVRLSSRAHTRLSHLLCAPSHVRRDFLRHFAMYAAKLELNRLCERLANVRWAVTRLNRFNICYPSRTLDKSCRFTSQFAVRGFATALWLIRRKVIPHTRRKRLCSLRMGCLMHFDAYRLQI